MTDRQIVAYTLSGFTIPESFVPTFTEQPSQPMSLQEKFGTEENNPDYFGVFSAYYNTETNMWTTDSLEIVPETLRDDVADWVVILSTYDSDYYTWQMGYEAARQSQWRFTLADLILA